MQFLPSRWRTRKTPEGYSLVHRGCECLQAVSRNDETCLLLSRPQHPKASILRRLYSAVGNTHYGHDTWCRPLKETMACPRVQKRPRAAFKAPTDRCSPLVVLFRPCQRACGRRDWRAARGCTLPAYLWQITALYRYGQLRAT